MDKRLKLAYINKMLPHLLPIRAREKGISSSDKKEWHELAGVIKMELSKRFDTISEDEYRKDMSFNKKKLPVVTSSKNYEDNDKLIDGAFWLPYHKKRWLKEARLELLDRATNAEKTFAQYLSSKGILAYQKMPFYRDEKIYFSYIYLPEHHAVIELTNTANRNKICVKTKQRISCFKSLGYDVYVVAKEDVHKKAFCYEFVEKLMK